MGSVLVDSLAHTVQSTVPLLGPDAPPDAPPEHPARTVQKVAGSIMGAISLPVELANTGFAVATDAVAQALPSFPVATLTSLYVGPPHAHAHPPSTVPPAPPVPLPSLGPVVLGTCVQVLINGMPAARAGDIGTAPTCGGFYPMYEIFLGSSKVFIGGMRAARMGDMCKACMPGGAGAVRGVAAAMAAAGQAVALTGVVADAAEAGVASDPNLAAAQAMAASMGAAQMAADAAAMAVMAAMGSDPAIPPAPGALVLGHPNVLVGGFPMINFPDPAAMLFGKLEEKVKNRRRRVRNNGCDGEGHPVSVVTGAAYDTYDDVTLPGALPVQWTRRYNSAWKDRDGVLGRGFRHHYERHLVPDLDGFRYVDQHGEAVTLPPLAPDTAEVAHDGVYVRRMNDRYYLVRVPGEPEMVFEHDADGEPARLAALQQGDARVQFQYSSRGFLESIVGAGGQALRLEYDDDHLVEISLDAGGWSEGDVLFRYAYDEAGCLVAAEDAAGHRASYAYDAAGRMTRQQDRRGYGFHYVYDVLGRCVRTHGDDGLYDVRLEYRPLERCTVATASDGGTRTYFYDANGTIVQIIDPYGGVYERRLDDRGRLVEEVDPNGNVTRVLYDAHDGAYAKVDPLGRLLTLDGRPFDDGSRGERTLPSTAPGWHFGTWMDPAALQPLQSTDPVLQRLPPGFYDRLADGPGREPIPSGPERDAAGRPLLERGPDGRIVRRRTYDPRGRVTEVLDDDGFVEQWRYDAEENPVAYRDADGSVRRYDYTSWNLVEQEVDPLGHVTAYAYSPREQVTEVTDPGGTRSSYAYDWNDRLVAVSRDGRLCERIAYDLADNPVARLGPDGTPRVRFEIGPGNLPTARWLADGERQTFTFDEQGRPTQLKARTGTVEVAYGPGPRIARDVRDGTGVEHAYDGTQHRGTTYVGRYTVQVDEPAAGERVMTDPLGRRHRFFVSEGGLAMAELAGGTSLVRHYDDRGRCRRSMILADGGLRERRYHYSPGGDLLTVHDDRDGTTYYQYDDAHRLIGAQQPDGTRQDYRHDPAGNLLRQPGLEGVHVERCNQLAAANGDRFAYDDREHLARREGPRGTTTYTYDAVDMLVRVDGPDGAWEAAYDPLGRRVVKRWGDHAVTFFWDGDRLAAEQDETGRLRLYLYADPDALVPFMRVDYDAPDAPPETGRAYTFVTDQVGTPVEVLDADGHTVWRARVDPYGTVHVEQGADFHQPLRFPGHYHDAETGLHYNRYRYYSPELGRYLQRDPLDTAGGVNLYAYTTNPLVEIDYLGLKCLRGHIRDFVGSVKNRLAGTWLGRLFGIPAPANPAQALPAPPPPRRVYGQEHPTTCGIASTRMVLHSETGLPYTEAHLRHRSEHYPGHWDPANGTYPENMVHVLREHGVNDARLHHSQTVDDLDNATQNGHPVIVQVDNLDANGSRTNANGDPLGSHFIVVDEVRTNPDQSRTVVGRDPEPRPNGSRFEVPADDFENGYNVGNRYGSGGGEQQQFNGWAVTTDSAYGSPDEVPTPRQQPQHWQDRPTQPLPAVSPQQPLQPAVPPAQQADPGDVTQPLPAVSPQQPLQPAVPADRQADPGDVTQEIEVPPSGAEDTLGPDDPTGEMEAFDPDKTQEMEALSFPEDEPTEEMEAFDPDKTQEMEALDFPEDRQRAQDQPSGDEDTLGPDDPTEEMEAFDPDKTQEFDPYNRNNP